MNRLENSMVPRMYRGILVIHKIIQTEVALAIKRLHVRPVQWKAYQVHPVQVSITLSICIYSMSFALSPQA